MQDTRMPPTCRGISLQAPHSHGCLEIGIATSRTAQVMFFSVSCPEKGMAGDQKVTIRGNK